MSTELIKTLTAEIEQSTEMIERLRNALTDALGHGETMPCGHNSRWLVYNNPVDFHSERHCLFCEVEKLRAALLEQAELWDLAKPILDAVDARSGMVPFMSIHEPAKKAREAARGEVTE